MMKQFLRDEEGQTTVEYLLIIAVVVVVISVLGKQLQTKIKDVTEQVFKNVNSQISALMKAGN